MLILHKCPSYQPISLYLNRIDFQSETLIISNLRSQKEVQNWLLKKQGFFLEDSVLRAGHFWRALLKKNSPQKKIISQELALTRIASFLKSQQNVFQVNESSTRIILKMLKELGRLLQVQNENFPWEEWLDTRPEMQKRLLPWMEITSSIYEQFRSRHELLEAWVPGELLQQADFERQWNRTLWIDLAGEISLSEAEIFQMISRHKDVHVLNPSPSWGKEFDFLLKPYRFLESKGVEDKKWEISLPEVKRQVVRAHKFSNRLAEIKFSIGQARLWIEQGIEPSRICILAADIETYWPALQAYLDQEGLTYQKNRVVKFANLPFFSQWIACLKIRLREIQKSTLEKSLFEASEKAPLKYEKFNSLYSHLYEEKDLGREPGIEARFSRKANRDDLVDFLTWMDWAAESLPAKESPFELEILVREVLAQVSSTEMLSYEKWLQWVELILAQKEKTIQEGQEKGISIQNLMAGHEGSVTHRLFLGLNDEDFKSSTFEVVNSEDRLRLGLDLGVEIEHPDQNFKKFHLRWLTSLVCEETHFCVGLTDFDGRLLNPNPFWHQFFYQNEKQNIFEVQSTPETRWDQLQKSNLQEVLRHERGLDEKALHWIFKRWTLDQRGEEKSEVPQSFPSLSPTSVTNWRNCPFVFKAQKIYRLESLPVADLETDPRPRGSMVHRLFELISLEPAADETRLEALVDQARQDVGEYFFRSQIWISQRKKWVELARRFSHFEKDWRQKFPHQKTVGREFPWEFHFDREQKVFQARTSGIPSTSLVSFYGKIDRIDQIENVGLVVLDYKGSLPDGAQFKDWLEKNQLQLLFYIWVIERKFIPEFQKDVVAAFFYDYKNFIRDAGLQLDLISPNDLPSSKRTKTKASIHEKENLLNKFEEELVKWISEMELGLFSARPRELEMCEPCEWRIACRAPHLN